MDVAGSRPTTTGWHEAPGIYRLFGGTTPIKDCEAHFHDTFIIGHIKRGGACVRINDEPFRLEPGSALLVNPFDIVECISDDEFDYDVCYPDDAFMREAMIRATGQVGEPAFARPVPSRAIANRIGAVLDNMGSPDISKSALAEHDLLCVLADFPELLTKKDRPERPACVDRSCALIDELIEEPLTVAEISSRVSRSRSHFSRTFRHAMGVSPGIYIRQLRLARALQRVRAGKPLADVAAHFGFADQAHFSREFKRVYGTAPGRVARDVSRCRHCA